MVLDIKIIKFRMKIISHRGLWIDEQEKNLLPSFVRSFNKNFGTETDLRDRNGEIIISHDIPVDNCLSFNKMIEVYKKVNSDLILALNIKSDGLQIYLKDILIEHSIKEYFVFDMSIPDTIGYLKLGIKFFSRQSEYEQVPIFYEKCNGIWLDSFESIWYNCALIENHIKIGKSVAVVSPDLHKRDVSELWELLRKNKINQIDNVILCTDKPIEALSFFN